jgi:hypothetical protein
VRRPTHTESRSHHAATGGLTQLAYDTGADSCGPPDQPLRSRAGGRVSGGRQKARPASMRGGPGDPPLRGARPQECPPSTARPSSLSPTSTSRRRPLGLAGADHGGGDGFADDRDGHLRGRSDGPPQCPFATPGGTSWMGAKSGPTARHCESQRLGGWLSRTRHCPRCTMGVPHEAAAGRADGRIERGRWGRAMIGVSIDDDRI